MISRPNSHRPPALAGRVALSKSAWLAAVCTFALICVAGTARGEEQLTEGSSSRKLRNETVQSLPFHQLTAEVKAKISPVLSKPSIYRRLPITSISCDPDYFRFLTRYPEVIVNIWQLMGVTNMTTQRTGPYSISTNDGAGTLSSLELIYGSDNLHIYYGKGTYEGGIVKRKMAGDCVLVLKTEASIDSQGQPQTTSQLDVFLKIENATAGLIAKTITPLVGSTADHNFVESMKFVQRLNDTTSKNGPGVQQMGEKLKIEADVRQKFNQVVDVVFQRAINAAAPPEVPTSFQVPAGSQRTPQPIQTNFSSPAVPPRSYQPNYQQTPRSTAPRSGFGVNANLGDRANSSFSFRVPSANTMMLLERQIQARGNQPPAYQQSESLAAARERAIQAGFAAWHAEPNRETNRQPSRVAPASWNH